MVWQPGISGNPSGKTRKPVIEAALRRAVSANDGALLRKSVERILETAAHGEGEDWRWACVYVRDTLDGKPTQRIESDGVAAGLLQLLSSLASRSIGAGSIAGNSAPALTQALDPASESDTVGFPDTAPNLAGGSPFPGPQDGGRESE